MNEDMLLLNLGPKKISYIVLWLLISPQKKTTFFLNRHVPCAVALPPLKPNAGGECNESLLPALRTKEPGDGPKFRKAIKIFSREG